MLRGSETAAVPSGIALQRERRTAAVPSGISAAVVVLLCYVVACMRLDVIAATVCMFVLVCVSAACIVRFFLIAARLAQAQTVRAVSEQ